MARRGECPKFCVNRVKQCKKGENIGNGGWGSNRPPYRHNSGGKAACQGHSQPNLLFWHPVGKVDVQLGVNHTPVLASACPFSGDIHHGQIQHLQQAVIRRENSLGLGHLPQLAVKPLRACLTSLRARLFGGFSTALSVYTKSGTLPTLSWLNHSRRLSKDYEISVSSAETMVIISHSHTLLKRL